MKITKSQLRQVIREAIEEVSGLDVYGDGQKDKPYVGLSPEETLAEVADDLEGIADQMVSAGEAEGKFAGLIQQVSDAILANLKTSSYMIDFFANLAFNLRPKALKIDPRGSQNQSKID